MAKKIVFTGQSGIKIEEALSRYVAEASIFRNERKPPAVYKVEREMKRIYIEDNKVPDSPDIWIDKLLTLPNPVLFSLWERACAHILVQIDKTPEQDVFLSLHACFYHLHTIEYLSFVKVGLLRNLRPTMFVNLIDDIYDIHTRLREPGQLFSGTRGGATSGSDSVFELLRVLDWRAKETMLTRVFANECGCPNFVFGIKHSHDTLSNLIYHEKPHLYLSHPITEVRRLQKLELIEPAQVIIDAIHSLEESAVKDFTAFLPTAIDELRIDQVDKKVRTEITKEHH